MTQSNPKLPKVILHVGTHKTGTTAIQAALALNRAPLRERGIHYPSLSPEFGKEAQGHHKVAHAAAQFTVKDRKKLSQFNRRIMGASRNYPLTVLSAEPIYRRTAEKVSARNQDKWFQAHQSYLNRIRETFSEFDIKIICYFRHPEKMAISLYKENITKGNFRGELADFLISRTHIFNYSRHLAVLEDVFGEVDVRIFEEEVKSGLIAGFIPDCGIEEMASLNQKQVRTSPSNRAAMWLRNAPADASRVDDRRRALFALRKSGSAIFSEEAQSTLWTGVGQAAEFVEKYKQSYRSPFPFTPVLSDLPSTVWTSQMQEKADAEFVEWELENQALLEARESVDLQLFAPDPAPFS